MSLLLVNRLYTSNCAHEHCTQFGESEIGMMKDRRTDRLQAECKWQLSAFSLSSTFDAAATNATIKPKYYKVHKKKSELLKTFFTLLTLIQQARKISSQSESYVPFVGRKSISKQVQTCLDKVYNFLFFPSLSLYYITFLNSSFPMLGVCSNPPD